MPGPAWENQRFYMLLLGNDVEWVEHPRSATQLNAKEAERWARGWNEHTVALDSDKKKGV